MVISNFVSGDISKFMELFIQEVCREVKREIDSPKCQDFGWAHPMSRVRVDPMPAMDVWDRSLTRADSERKGWQHSLCLMAASGGLVASDTGARDITGKASNGRSVSKYSR